MSYYRNMRDGILVVCPGKHASQGCDGLPRGRGSNRARETSLPPSHAQTLGWTQL